MVGGQSKELVSLTDINVAVTDSTIGDDIFPACSFVTKTINFDAKKRGGGRLFFSSYKWSV
jgi:hypothetical protein